MLGYLRNSACNVTRSLKLHWLGMFFKKGGTRKIPFLKMREGTDDALKMSKYSIRALRKNIFEKIRLYKRPSIGV